MEGSSAFQFVRVAYVAGLVSRRRLAADAWANFVFRLRGANEADTTAVRDRISHDMTGVRVCEMERLGASLLVRVLPRIYPQMLELAYEHQDAGRRVYIITAAAHELAQMLARVLAFDGGIGSRFSEIRDGVFTGRPTGVFIYGAGKAQAIAELAEREGIDLAGSYAYSDSESDLPMLRLVGHPVAVNPDAQLTRIARAEGWDVLRIDRLGRRLKAGAAVASAALAGGLGSAVITRGRNGARSSRQIRPRTYRTTRRPARRRVPPGALTARRLR
ncbi:MAG: HAD-IB family hydrolase [Solirubrobacterales bacterium]|nr:HAD-IB family hydrolase [Solirubrobacterales bacterium]MBV9168402.1 HAD-IB family hydrolase [Solirubrobacterales bacterium]MBV9536777.1 HAD-IB family hydrolase [Solirubrobacterales bacterium]